MLRLSFAEGKQVAGGNGGAQRSTDGCDRVLLEISDGSVKALRFRLSDRPFGLIPTDRTDRTDGCPPVLGYRSEQEAQQVAQSWETLTN
jgi:hypothetical protein